MNVPLKRAYSEQVKPVVSGPHIERKHTSNWTLLSFKTCAKRTRQSILE